MQLQILDNLIVDKRETDEDQDCNFDLYWEGFKSFSPWSEVFKLEMAVLLWAQKSL